MHEKEKRAYGKDCKSLALGRDALRVKGIYFNKECVSKNESLWFVCEICYSEYGCGDVNDYRGYFIR